jgi:hypothetical protein
MIYTEKYLNKETEEKEAIEDNYNLLATFLLPNREKVYGVAVIYVMNVKKQSFDSKLDIDLIKFLINRRENLTVVCIKPLISGLISEEEQLTTDVFEIINKKELNNNKYIVHEKTIFGETGYKLIMWKNENDISTDANWHVSRFLGYKVTGTWYVTIHNNYYDNQFNYNNQSRLYSDLTSEEIKLLSNICIGSTSNIQLKESEKKLLLESSNNKTICSRFLLLENRIETLNNNCFNCKQQFEPMKYCGGCYRARYCSDNCRNVHWKFHSKDCSWNKNSENTNNNLEKCD